MNIVCIIQARTSSSRLTGKVLLKLPYNSEKTVLDNVLDRIKKSIKINKIVVATTVNKCDDILEDIATKNGVDCYRGSEDNVLSRYYEVAVQAKADLVVRITSDCPCIDWLIIDNLVEKHLIEKNDYTSNTLKRSFPHGLDCEVFNFEALEVAYQNANEKYEIEHVTPYFYKSHPDQFKIGIMEATQDSHDIRITLDTKEDYTLLCEVYDQLFSQENTFTYTDIVNLFAAKGWLYYINQPTIQKKVCKNLEEEVEEALTLLENQDLIKAKEFLKDRYYGEK